MLLEDSDLVAERHQIVRDGQRGRPGAYAGDALSVLLGRDDREAVVDIAAKVGRHALQAADGDGCSVHAPSPAGRLARAVASAAQNSRKDVGLAVEHVGIGVPALRDQPDVFGDIGVRRAGPLAIDHLVVIAGIADICRLHASIPIFRGPSGGPNGRLPPG